MNHDLPMLMPGDKFTPQTDPIYAITCVSNFEGWASRARTHQRFAEAFARHPGFHLITVEVVVGDRKFEVTDASNPDHVQFRVNQDYHFFGKEGYLNAGIRTNLTRRFPAWRKLMWIDADVMHVRADLADAVSRELDHENICATHTQSADLGAHHEIIANEGGEILDRSFGAACVVGDAHVPGVESYHRQKAGRVVQQHYGYAGAIRRETYDAIGGFPDRIVTGAGDYHLWLAAAGLEVEDDKDLSPGYNRYVREITALFDRTVKGRIGAVRGQLLHFYHGKKAQRQYRSRRSIIVDSQFDPYTDVIYDAHGLPFVSVPDSKRARAFHRGMRTYLSGVNADFHTNEAKDQ